MKTSFKNQIRKRIMAYAELMLKHSELKSQGFHLSAETILEEADLIKREILKILE